MTAATPAAATPAPVEIAVIAKAPVPGRSKTRLMTAFTAEQAAALAEAALLDTLAAARGVPAARIVVHLDGEPGPWLPPGARVRPQCDGPFDVRLDHAVASHAGPVLVIGMDTPQLTAGQLTEAAARLAAARLAAARPAADRMAADRMAADRMAADRMAAAGPSGPHPEADEVALLGLATDGGWWALGLTHPRAGLLAGVVTSRPDTGERQRQRLTAAGLTVQLLGELTDVDTPADAARVAAQAPDTRFARLLRHYQALAVPA